MARDDVARKLPPGLKDHYEKVLHDSLVAPYIFTTGPVVRLPWWRKRLNRLSWFGYRLRRAWLILIDKEMEQ